MWGDWCRHQWTGCCRGTDGSKQWCTYMLHVSRKTLNCRGDSTLYFSQKVLFCLRASHILLGQEMNKTPASKERELFLKTWVLWPSTATGWNCGKVAVIRVSRDMNLRLFPDVSIKLQATSHHPIFILQLNYIVNLTNKYLISPLIGTILHGMLWLSMSLEKEGTLKSDCSIAFM